MILSPAKQVFWTIGIVFALSCALALFACGSVTAWVGHKDLQVQFLVTDANSGAPVPNATIHIRAEAGGFCSDRDPMQFTVATDSKGIATRTIKQCMCFGKQGMFQDSFGMHLPLWWCHASAEGFTPSEPISLEAPEYARRVKRLRLNAELTVELQLRKAA
jgi:hypothetical protein